MPRVLRPTTIFLLATVAFAQTVPTGVQKKDTVAGITEYDFPNGLRALLFPDASTPKITVNMTVLVGSRHEGYGETGMAHLLEHMNFIRSTHDRDIKKELVDHGAQWNGTTDYDRTNYFETFTASDENLKWALGLEAERLVNMRMEKRLLDTEMTVVRNEFERGENNNLGILEERVISTAYLWHNYGKSTIGSRADIEKVPIDRLAAFYRKYYQPDNAVLVVSGKIDPAKTLAYINDACGAIPRPARKLEEPYTVEPAQDGERYVALRRVGEGQGIVIAYHAPAAAHPDSAPLEILEGIMNGQNGTGRLTKALVDNRKTVSARMSFEELHDPGFVLFTANLSKDQSLADARKAMLDAIAGVVSEPPSKDEVERVKTRFRREMEMRMANSQQVALGLSESIADGDWRLMFLSYDEIAKVTPEDVVRVAKTYFKASNRTVGEFIPDANPDRVEVPATPELMKLFDGYKSTLSISEGEAFDPTPANIEKRVIRATLSDGLRIVMLPKATRGATVSAVVQIEFGDEKSLAGKAEIAQLTGAMLMRGTKSKTREQLQAEMDRLNARISVSGGGSFGGGRGGGGRGGFAGSSISSATASIETTEGNLIPALRLALEILRDPAFPESDFEQIRKQRIAAIERGRTEPSTLAVLALERSLNPYPKGDPRYVPTIDEQIEELNKVTLDDIRNFHKQFYGASRGEVVVVGQFNPGDVQKTAAGLLSPWRNGAPFTRITSRYARSTPANLKIETPDKPNATFAAGIRIPMSEGDPDYPAMVLANYMFGGALTSRMPNRIRNVEGLSYSVSSQFSAPAEGDAALFAGTAISNPKNTPKVEASFTDELRKTLATGFTAEEVAIAKKAFHDQRTVQRSQDQSLLRVLAAREEYGRTMHWDEQLEAKIEALTADQINAAFRKYINPAGVTIVKAGDFKAAAAYE